MEEASEVYHLIAGQDEGPLMSREELLKAHHGDTALFGKLDHNHDSRVTEEEWLLFLRKSQAEQEREEAGKGDLWLHSVLFTLGASLNGQ